MRDIVNVSGTLAIAATIFVPKLGDIGAYLIGSLFGKHLMTPTLSPKKTWEGFFGGLAVSILTAVAFNFIGPEPLFRHGIPEAIGFGVAVGLAGVFGDLFASMIKRDAQVKDASQSIPGFGGVLDVVDSVLFAAPVAYLFFVW
jgi:phosphatidate cytidylyltransferase